MRYTFFLCVTPFFERLSINGNSLDFGRRVKKIAGTGEKKMLVPGTESDTRVPVLKDLDTGLTSSG